MPTPSLMFTYPDPVVVAGGATGAAPTVVTDGFNLAGLLSYRVIVSADLNQLLTGAGWMRAYLWSLFLTRWVRSPDLDFPITPIGGTFASARDRVSLEFDVPLGMGRGAWRPDGVATDAGNVTTQIEAAKVLP